MAQHWRESIVGDEAVHLGRAVPLFLDVDSDRKLAYASATLVEDCERVIDGVGYAEVRVRGLHG